MACSCSKEDIEPIPTSSFDWPSFKGNATLSNPSLPFLATSSCFTNNEYNQLLLSSPNMGWLQSLLSPLKKLWVKLHSVNHKTSMFSLHFLFSFFAILLSLKTQLQPYQFNFLNSFKFCNVLMISTHITFKYLFIKKMKWNKANCNLPISR